MPSTIGKPLFTDHMTAEKERLAYARLYVEVGVSSDLPESIQMQDMDCQKIDQKIEYE